MWHDVKLLNTVANALLALFALMLLAAGVWWLMQRPMFTLAAIEVQGPQQTALRHVSVSTMRATALPRIRGNFFTVNLDSVRTAFEAVPWVRKASVRREWPNRLDVTLEEHVPLGTWGDEGRLVSVEGELFTVNLAEAEEDGDLVALDGPEGSEKDVVARFDELRQWFAAVGLAPEMVQLSARYAWDVKLNNGMKVELGREQTEATISERVARLIAVYPQLVTRLQDRIESIDLRYPNGMALTAEGMKFGSNNQKDHRKASGTT